MDSTRFILLLSLSLVALLLWDAWQKDYGKVSVVPEQSAEKVEETSHDLPNINQISKNDSSETATTVPLQAQTEKGKLISVSTDLFKIKISTQGGNLVDANLRKFPQKIGEAEPGVQILSDKPEDLYIIQGGLLSKQSAPTHESEYVADKDSYVMDKNQNELTVPLHWQSSDGLMVTKLITFHRNEYQVDINYEVNNQTGTEWDGRAYGQIQRLDAPKKRTGAVYTYTGAVISSPDKRYEKVSFDKLKKNALDMKITDGWIAMIQHYFVTALIPSSRESAYKYYSLYIDKSKSHYDKDHYIVGLSSPQKNLSSGSKATFSFVAYIGPKIQSRLEQVAPSLELTVDYGVLWFIAKPIFWCLQKFHELTGNWGWAIILVTLMLKLLFYNLSAAGYRSMARMRKMQPRLLALRERFKDDKQGLNRAMMDLYKQEKINPLGGCLPIVIQIPVFISLYWVLLESVELRQTGFIWWIKDLSTADPYFVLPLIMGVTMFVQQKLNPAPMDPVQEKVMMLLPFIFTVFFAFFPSGLVLYWVVNNILSIAQQWNITRNLERAGLKR